MIVVVLYFWLESGVLSFLDDQTQLSSESISFSADEFCPLIKKDAKVIDAVREWGVHHNSATI